MRKLLILWIILLTAGIVFGQEKDYRQAAKAAEEYIKELKKQIKDQGEWDGASRAMTRDALDQLKEIVDAGEQALKAGYDFVVEPLYYLDLTYLEDIVRVQGDWGADYLGIEDYREEIKKRATRKVLTVTFDTGRPNHVAIQPYIYDYGGKNWTSSPDETDIHSHSTHCMGIKLGLDQDPHPNPIAEVGLHRSAWQKVLSDSGSGSYAWVANAVTHANSEVAPLIEQGWFIIYSFSLGGGTAPYDPLESAFQSAVDMGVLILTSAGNTGSYMTYPSLSEHVEGVGALAKTSTGVARASYSSYGEKLYGAAPGSAVYSTVPGDKYAYKSGTSMACPYMVQVFTILASVYPQATARELLAHVAKYGTDLPPTGRDDETGFGWPKIGPLLENSPGDLPDPPPPPKKEICDNGIDDDGDGLVDCDDPDCAEFVDCKEPDPEPPPVVKPERDYIGTYPLNSQQYYTTSYRVSGDPESHRYQVKYRITVRAKTKELMDLYADKLEAAMDAYARNRSYGLSPNSDMWDGLKAISYFTDMILATRSDLDIEQVDIEGTVDGRYIRVTEKDFWQYKSSTNSFFKRLFVKDFKSTNQINMDWWADQRIPH